jgi:transcriptional regulator with XRE-family HTH domain
MSGSPSTPLARQARQLSQILRMLRKERRMTVAEVAAGMGIAVRTYQDFEAGRGGLDLAKIRLFALATGSDAISILLALMFNEPALARQTMDNKLPTTFWIWLGELRDEAGEQLNVVPPALVLEGFRRLSEEIKGYLRKRAETAEDWLARAITETYLAPDKDADRDGDDG